jgi:biotin carboxyl carrier protein
MLKATVNNTRTFDIEESKGTLLLNQEPFDWDLIHVRDNIFHVVYQNRSFNAEVVEANYAEKSFSIRINQNVYNVSVKDRFDLLLDQMGMSGANTAKLNHIKAPMPGKVLEMKVAVGDVVKKGDTVLILEAMKMENVIKAPGDGTVKSVRVNAQESVEKNAVLVEFE